MEDHRPAHRTCRRGKTTAVDITDGTPYYGDLTAVYITDGTPYYGDLRNLLQSAPRLDQTTCRCGLTQTGTYVL